MFYFLLKVLLTEITILASKDMVATFFKYYVIKHLVCGTNYFKI